MYLRKPAVPGLLIAASVIALSTGCGLVDKAKDKADGDDKKKNDPAATASQVPGASGGAQPTGGGKDSRPTGAPGSAQPGGADVSGKDFCSLLTPAELKVALGAEVERTKNDGALHTCRYYGPGDASLLTVQYFTHSSKLQDTPDTIVARNKDAKFGQKITDLGAFPTVYIPAGTYPAPGTPDVYFAKPHTSKELIVEVHVSLSPAQKDLSRATHIAVAKAVAGKL